MSPRRRRGSGPPRTRGTACLQAMGMSSGWSCRRSRRRPGTGSGWWRWSRALGNWFRPSCTSTGSGRRSPRIPRDRGTRRMTCAAWRSSTPWTSMTWCWTAPCRTVQPAPPRARCPRPRRFNIELFMGPPTAWQGGANQVRIVGSFLAMPESLAPKPNEHFGEGFRTESSRPLWRARWQRASEGQAARTRCRRSTSSRTCRW